METNRMGIYKITNIINNKIYVGSAINLNKRKKKHLYDLKHNIHHSIHLQRAWGKYGEDNFSFEVIEYIEDKDILKEREQYWIDTLNVCDINYGYNILPTAGNSLGYKMSEEGKRKIRDSSRGEKNSNAKLTDTQVYQVKEMCRDGFKNKEIAEKFEVTPSYINRIRIGDSWKHVKVDGFVEKNKHLTIEQIIKIKKLLKENLKTRDIIKLTGINSRIIRDIKNEKCWSNVV